MRDGVGLRPWTRSLAHSGDVDRTVLRGSRAHPRCAGRRRVAPSERHTGRPPNRSAGALRLGGGSCAQPAIDTKPPTIAPYAMWASTVATGVALP